MVLAISFSLWVTSAFAQVSHTQTHQPPQPQWQQRYGQQQPQSQQRQYPQGYGQQQPQRPRYRPGPAGEAQEMRDAIQWAESQGGRVYVRTYAEHGQQQQQPWPSSRDVVIITDAPAGYSPHGQGAYGCQGQQDCGSGPLYIVRYSETPSPPSEPSRQVERGADPVREHRADPVRRRERIGRPRAVRELREVERAALRVELNRGNLHTLSGVSVRFISRARGACLAAGDLWSLSGDEVLPAVVGNCVALPRSSRAVGIRLIQAVESENQEVQIVRDLDSSVLGAGDGETVQFYPGSVQSGTQWIVIPVGQRSFRLMSTLSRKCLDATPLSTLQGSRRAGWVSVSNCGDSPRDQLGQLWHLGLE